MFNLQNFFHRLADFNQPTLKLIIQLYTAFLFIFDACIIPDFLSSIDPKSQKREKDFDDMEKKVSMLEKKIEVIEKKLNSTDEELIKNK